MPLKSLQHIKVIVQLNNDNDYEEVMNNCEAICDGESHALATSDILILNEKTLEIHTTECEEMCHENFRSQKMIFDFVCDALKDDLQTQFDDVMEKLLWQKDHCCLIRFTLQEKTNVTILFVDQLITTLNDHLQIYKCKMHNCDLICTDIWMVKSDTNLCDTVGGYSPAHRLHGSKILRNITNNFRNIHTLKKWLLNDYRSKTQAINSYEKLQFIFTIYDPNEKITYTVNLYLYNIYVNLMTEQDHNHWHHYMLHLSDDCSDEECQFVHSGLTVSLLSHLKGELSKHSYFLFDIVKGQATIKPMIDILKIADFIMKCRTKVEKVLMERSLNQSTMSPFTCRRPNMVTNCGNNTQSTNYIEITDNNNNNNKMNNSSNNRNNNKNKKNIELKKINESDLSQLHLWHERIDDCVNKLYKSRDAYYAEYFDKKILHINNYVVALITTCDTFNETHSKWSTAISNPIELLYNNYNEMRIDFMKIYHDVNASTHKAVLENYFTIKNFDNEEKAKKLQVNYLRQLQIDLNEFIEQMIIKITSTGITNVKN